MFLLPLHSFASLGLSHSFCDRARHVCLLCAVATNPAVAWSAPAPMSPYRALPLQLPTRAPSIALGFFSLHCTNPSSILQSPFRFPLRIARNEPDLQIRLTLRNPSVPVCRCRFSVATSCNCCALLHVPVSRTEHAYLAITDFTDPI